jgi:thiol:disulfide interchange protein
MNKQFSLFFISLFLVFTPLCLLAEDRVEDPVKWTFSVEKEDDRTFVLLFDAALDESWHFYSQYLPTSPPGTSFVFAANDSYERIGRMEESATKEKFDETLGYSVSYFNTEAHFRQKVVIKEKGAVKVEGFVEYMACRETVCLSPKEVPFSFILPPDTVVMQQYGDKKSTPAPPSALSGGLVTFFFLSFAAGLAAILTPCVFPMIPMTVSFFIHGKKRLGRLQALVYGLSIIGIYTLVGTLLALLIGPGFANWLATHWVPNVLFFLVFLFFSAALLGLFELQLPRWLIEKSDRQADKGGFVGIIFMAVTLVLVSFSCTGPIVGVVLVESAGGMVIKPVVGMFGFSLAFALPFTFFAFFPTLLNKMPRSGSWLNTGKVILGFLELALALKFLSVADQAYHWGILDRDVYLALWIAIFGLLGAYLIGLFSLPLESEKRGIGVSRIFTAVLVFAFVVYLIPGMFGAPLSPLSGYLPPMKRQAFSTRAYSRLTTGLQGGCEEPDYRDFLQLPHGLDGYFDLAQALTCAKSSGKPVLIDFTGHGCVNCREMEATVWADPRVLKLLDQFVVVALYVDDKTPLPEEQHYVSPYDNKVKKSLGRKNSDLQIRLFQINAQPYYVLLTADGDLLAPPKAYDLEVDRFISFLKLGLENFRLGKKVGGVDLTEIL